MTDLHGVDLASFQGAPGTWTPAAGKIAFAAVKLTELSPQGPYVNPDAEGDWDYLRRNDKLSIAYLFAHPAADSGETVSAFLAELKHLGYDDADMIAVDLEVTDGKSPAEVSSWALGVCSALEAALGRLPLVYTFPAFAEAGNCAGLERFPLWISDPSHAAGHPAVPRPWKTWSIHQYSTSGAIDRDLAGYTTAAHMLAHLGRKGAVVPKRKPVTTAAKKAGKAVKGSVQAKPVSTTAAVASALTAAVALLAPKVGLHLTATELRAVVTALPALAAIWSAMRTSPPATTVIHGAVPVIVAAAAAFGAHLPAGDLAALVPAFTTVMGAATDLHVTPKATRVTERVVART